MLDHARTVLDYTVRDQSDTVLDQSDTVLDQSDTVLDQSDAVLDRPDTVLGRNDAVLDQTDIEQVALTQGVLVQHLSQKRPHRGLHCIHRLVHKEHFHMSPLVHLENPCHKDFDCSRG